MGGDERARLAQLVEEFERGRLEEEELESALEALAVRVAEGAEGAAPQLPSDLSELRSRLEMIRFNVCAAERRGALLELLRDFQASFPHSA